MRSDLQKTTRAWPIRLDGPRDIGIVNVPVRIAAKTHAKLDKTALSSAPRVERESLRHIGTIEQGTTGPDLAVSSPTLRDPLDVWVCLAEMINHRSWSRGSLAIEETSLQTTGESAAHKEKRLALLVALLDELDLCLGESIAGVIRSHQDDVQWWTGSEGVLMKRQRLPSEAVVYWELTVGLTVAPAVSKAPSPDSFTQYDSISNAWSRISSLTRCEG